MNWILRIFSISKKQIGFDGEGKTIFFTDSVSFLFMIGTSNLYCKNLSFNFIGFKELSIETD